MNGTDTRLHRSRWSRRADVTALGLCLALLATAAQAREVDYTRLERGFVSGCLRQQVGCTFQHVQWLDMQRYRIREVYVRRIRDAQDAQELRDWLTQSPACPGLHNDELQTANVTLEVRRQDAWQTLEAPRADDGCLRAQTLALPAPGVVKLALETTVVAPPSAYSSFSARYETAFSERVGIVLQPGAVRVHVDMRDPDGSRTVGLLDQPQYLLREVGQPAKAIASLAASTVPSWQALAQLHRQREDALLDADSALPRFESASPEQVLQHSVRWVQQQVRYDYTRLRDGAVFPTRPVSALLSSGVADCKGIALLLRAVLRRNGLDAHTVAVSTVGLRPASWIVPGAWANHVITNVPALDRYVDAGVRDETRPGAIERGIARFELGLDLATGRFGVIQ